MGEVDQATGTKKRPDYFLVGQRIRGRRASFKVVVLECKGTHQTHKFAVEQLARATAQVEAVRVGGHTPPSLMVASHLARTRITSYVLDPEGEDDLWSGTNQDMDEFLSAEPAEQRWHARPAERPPQAVPDTSDNVSSPASGDNSGLGPEVAPQSDLQIFDIPEERRGWFTQVLTRAAAATALLFAGNSEAARGYATPRQRGEKPSTQTPLFDIDPPWVYSTSRSFKLPNGIRLEGTQFRAPLPDGKNLEVFRGVDARLYRLLAEGKIGSYLRAVPRTYDRWSRANRTVGAAVSLGRDGTALIVRLTDRR